MNDLNTFTNKKIKPYKLLSFSVTLWFIVTVIGIWFFAYYISSLYGGSSIQGDFESWNNTLMHGYVPGETIGNFAIITHLLFAVIMNVGGPLQFVPQIQKHYRRFHRWNGRLFLITALIMSFSGLYLSFSGRTLDSTVVGKIPLGISAVLAIIFAVLALRTAVTRNFKMHYRWALRLFIVVNSVFFSRAGFMFWLFLNGEGTINFALEDSFTTFLDLTVDSGLFPLFILELYLRSKRSKNARNKFVMGILFFALTIVMSIGVYAAIKGMWLPLM